MSQEGRRRTAKGVPQLAEVSRSKWRDGKKRDFVFHDRSFDYLEIEKIASNT